MDSLEVDLEVFDGVLEALLVPVFATVVAGISNFRIDLFQFHVDFRPTASGLLVLPVGLPELFLGGLPIGLGLLDAVGNLVPSGLEFFLVANMVVHLGPDLFELLLGICSAGPGRFELPRDLLQFPAGADAGGGGRLFDSFVLFFLGLGERGLVVGQGVLLRPLVLVVEVLEVLLFRLDGMVEGIEGFFVGRSILLVLCDKDLVIGNLLLEGLDFFLDPNEGGFELIDRGGQFDPLLVGFLVGSSGHRGLLLGPFERTHLGFFDFFLFLHLGPEFGEVFLPFLAIDFHVIDLPQVVIGKKLLSVCLELIKALGFLLLFLEESSLSLHSLLLVVGKERGCLRLVLRGKSRLVGPLQFGTL
mmetsp:Transcript_27372/g.74847  ORF Transcript_27372/g.74847 Transcript_27372/m.74847 type:complete len:359 (-) Transcript_27372:1042-2118(-)